MTRVENAERPAAGVQSSSSSITLLQERFRQLRKAKEMREEKKMSRMLSVKPNINAITNKFHHHHQFKSSSSSSSTSAARNTAVSRGLLSFDLPDDYQLINSSCGVSHQSRSASNSSSSPTRPLKLGQRSRYGQEDEQMSSHNNNNNNNKKEKMSSLQYYCDIGKFLNKPAAESKAVRQLLRDGITVQEEEDEEEKRFDGVRSYYHHDDIDTSLHL